MRRRSFRRCESFFIIAGLAASVAACNSARGRGDTVADGGTIDSGLPPTKVTQTVIAAGTPADAPNSFSSTNSNPANAPTVVYPPNGVIMPPNLTVLEFQWTPAAGTNLFELHFVSTYLDLSVYTICNPVGTGCGYSPDDPTWMLIATQSRGDVVTLTVRGSDGFVVGDATSRTLSFTNEDLLGGLYYWAAADGQIVRYDFGKRGQQAEAFYSSGDAGALCVGCHSLARNGQRIAVGLNAPIPTAGMRVLDIATKTAMFNSASNFEAFSPDASRILANNGGDLNLLDAATGTQIGTTPAITNGNLPDWSADGTKVVFARTGGMACPVPGLCDTIPGVTGADLFTVSVSGDTFGTPQMILTGGGNNFYPTFSPDGALVAFNRSSTNASSFDAPDARVWVVAASGGTPVALANASATGGNVGDSWPKFAPYSHTFKSDTIFWLTFSSRRDYGLRLINSTKPVSDMDDERISQIWMVGVPASAVLSGAMPSGGYPAFWLPFQSMTSGNHIAQWTETIARMPCSQIDGTPCPQGQDCENGECVGVPVL